MKVIARFEFNDDTLRQIKHHQAGRGGKATRKECLDWLAGQVERGLRELPEAKVRGARPPATLEASGAGQDEPTAIVAPASAVTASTRRDMVRDRFTAAKAAPEDAICSHCGRPKSDHGKMGFVCPPVIGKPRGRMFEAVEEGATA